MDLDYRIKKTEDFQILKAKLSMIRFLGFNLKPFSLGVMARYIYYRKHFDDWYLAENEFELKQFLDYILDDNPIAKNSLSQKHKRLYDLANEIMQKDEPQLKNEDPEWKMIKLYLNYIDTKDEAVLYQIGSSHEKGEIICHYLKVVTINSAASKQYLEDWSLYSLAFAESLMYCNQMGLDCLLIKDRTKGKK